MNEYHNIRNHLYGVPNARNHFLWLPPRIFIDIFNGKRSKIKGPSRFVIEVIFFLKCLVFNLTFDFDANNDHEADNVGGASSIRHEDS